MTRNTLYEFFHDDDESVACLLKLALWEQVGTVPSGAFTHKSMDEQKQGRSLRGFSVIESTWQRPRAR